MKSQALKKALKAHKAINSKEQQDTEYLIAFIDKYQEQAFNRRHDQSLEHPEYGNLPGHLVETAWIVDQSEAEPQVLMIHHNFLQRWLSPGGHCDLEDIKPGDAAVREAIEETGIDLDIQNITPRLWDVDVHPIPANPNKQEPEHLHLNTNWYVEASIKAPLKLALAEVADSKWFKLSEVPLLLKDGAISRMVQKTKQLT